MTEFYFENSLNKKRCYATKPAFQLTYVTKGYNSVKTVQIKKQNTDNKGQGTCDFSQSPMRNVGEVAVGSCQ